MVLIRASKTHHAINYSIQTTGHGTLSPSFLFQESRCCKWLWAVCVLGEVGNGSLLRPQAQMSTLLRKHVPK